MYQLAIRYHTHHELVFKGSMLDLIRYTDANDLPKGASWWTFAKIGEEVE
jgi:hypothetical protein